MINNAGWVVCKNVNELNALLNAQTVCASVRLLDALRYNSLGPLICRVKFSGEFQHTEVTIIPDHPEYGRVGKITASSDNCRIASVADATKMLDVFMCDMAEMALGFRGITDPRPWHAIEAKRVWRRLSKRDRDLTEKAAWAAVRDAERPLGVYWTGEDAAVRSAPLVLSSSHTALLLVISWVVAVAANVSPNNPQLEEKRIVEEELNTTLEDYACDLLKGDVA